MADIVVRNDEVVGSIPTSSTNLLNHLPRDEDTRGAGRVRVGF